MFRNMYDTDVTVWSPEGRLLQVRFNIFIIAIKNLVHKIIVTNLSVSYLLLTRLNMPWNL